MKTEYIIIHHSASPSDTTVEQINSWHKDRGFPLSKLGFHAGYHYIIESNGKLHQTRNDDEVGAHAKDDGMNFKSIGICLTGNFEYDDPTDAQEKELGYLVSGLQKNHSISNENVIGHRDVKTTACPGSKLYRLVKSNYFSQPEPPSATSVAPVDEPVEKDMWYTSSTGKGTSLSLKAGVALALLYGFKQLGFDVGPEDVQEFIELAWQALAGISLVYGLGRKLVLWVKKNIPNE